MPRKVIILVTMMGVLCTSSVPAFSEQLTIQPIRQNDQNEWQMYNENGDVVGTLKKTEEGDYKIFNKDGKYLGRIFRSGRFCPPDSRNRHTTITPEAAQLYLDVLSVIKDLGKSATN